MKPERANAVNPPAPRPSSQSRFRIHLCSLRSTPRGEVRRRNSLALHAVKSGDIGGVAHRELGPTLAKFAHYAKMELTGRALSILRWRPFGLLLRNGVLRE